MCSDINDILASYAAGTPRRHQIYARKLREKKTVNASFTRDSSWYDFGPDALSRGLFIQDSSFHDVMGRPQTPGYSLFKMPKLRLLFCLVGLVAVPGWYDGKDREREAHSPARLLTSDMLTCVKLSEDAGMIDERRSPIGATFSGRSFRQACVPWCF